MKFTVAAGKLAGAMRRVGGVVEKKHMIPVLANVLVEAKPKKGVTLTGSDLDVVMRLEVLAKVEAAGAVTVNADLLERFAGKLDKAAQVLVELEGGASGGGDRLKLSSGRSRLALVTLPAEDFPHGEAAEYPHSFVLPAPDLAALLGAGFACSTEETRYYLNGVYLHVPVPGPRLEEQVGGGLRAVATDGHRLAQVDRDVEMDMDMPGVIVPRKTLKIVAGMCADAGEDDDVDVALSETGIRFEFPGIALMSKLIDGTFPDYERVIPTDNGHVVTAFRTVLIAALDRVAVLGAGDSRAVKLTVAGSDTGGEDAAVLRLEVRNPEAGEGSDEIDVSYTGPELPQGGVSIGFNAKYLGEVLRQVAGEQVAIAIDNAGAPAVFTMDESDLAEGDPGPRALFVIMPLRV